MVFSLGERYPISEYYPTTYVMQIATRKLIKLLKAFTYTRLHYSHIYTIYIYICITHIGRTSVNPAKRESVTCENRIAIINGKFCTLNRDIENNIISLYLKF